MNPFYHQESVRKSLKFQGFSGAVAGNRTRDTYLEGRSFTSKLRPQALQVCSFVATLSASSFGLGFGWVF